MSRILLLLCVSIIFVLGLVMIFSTTSAEILDHDLDLNTHQALLKQMFYAFIGVCLAIGLFRWGYIRLIQYSSILYIILVGLLILVLIPGIGREVNGSKRWLHLAGMSFQPSEFLKYVLPCYFIYHIQVLQTNLSNLKSFFKFALKIFFPIFLVLIEPNNGTAAVLGITVLVLCALTNVPFRFWALPLCIGLCIGGIFAYQSPYVSARLRVYLHPELDIKGKGHQPYQAKIATGSGGIFGRGPGASLQKLSYLPEAQNDYIAAIFAEEFGFFGICVLVSLYLTITVVGFYLSSLCIDKRAFYLGGTITFLISFQAFMNLGVVSGLLPSTGLNLPFFSQGGTSLMANIMGIGILCSLVTDTSQPKLKM